MLVQGRRRRHRVAPANRALSSRSRRIRASQRRIGCSPPVTPIMGRADEARTVIRRLRTFAPAVNRGASFLKNPEHRKLLLSGCAWRWARRHERDPPPRRGARRRCRRLFAADRCRRGRDPRSVEVEPRRSDRPEDRGAARPPGQDDRRRDARRIRQRHRCAALCDRDAAGDGRAERRRLARQSHRISHRHQCRRHRRLPHAARRAARAPFKSD
jgi:hypothetical protein